MSLLGEREMFFEGRIMSDLKLRPCKLFSLQKASLSKEQEKEAFTYLRPLFHKAVQGVIQDVMRSQKILQISKR